MKKQPRSIGEEMQPHQHNQLFLQFSPRGSLERTVTGESTIEAYLRDKVKTLGGKAYKFVSPGNAGVPDRLVLFPGGRVVFVELKASGKKPTALQKAHQKKISSLGFEVVTIDSKAGVDELTVHYKGLIGG